MWGCVVTDSFITQAEEALTRFDDPTQGGVIWAFDLAVALRSLLGEYKRQHQQLQSLLHPTTSTGYTNPRDTWPDDTEINASIAEEETVAGALFEIAEKYGADVTNNLPRWQDGVFLREVGEFIGDVMTAFQQRGWVPVEGEDQ